MYIYVILSDSNIMFAIFNVPQEIKMQSTCLIHLLSDRTVQS